MLMRVAHKADGTPPTRRTTLPQESVISFVCTFRQFALPLTGCRCVFQLWIDSKRKALMLASGIKVSASA